MKLDFPDSSQIPGLRSLWQEAFVDTDEFLDIFFTRAFSPKRSRCITSESTVISALYWFDCECRKEKIAYIYAVATASAHRGQGLCRTLMEDTHKHLTEAGYAGAILVPGSTSLFGFYERMGYQTCSYVSEFECKASEDNIDLRSISKEEYSALRRSFLTDGAVIQERENTEFLSAYSKFYAGDSFVLATHIEDKTLICHEILGDTSKAPIIVNTLNCEKGIFRTQGDSKPFAMYYPLSKKGETPPSYFGLAFD